ncbi:hypothetical protein [Streptomyces sp. NPDC015125]|uniref:hypothetical protein n=1 Tax=Streptomyces sp. NPDC015125 TaxID=3364938 RepID=UPI0036F4D85E
MGSPSAVRMPAVRVRPSSHSTSPAAHAHTIKLPVWHREQDPKLAEQYVSAARKAGEHHEELL